jgi:hypothetical protein
LLRIDAALPAGLFGHLFKLARASEVTAVVNHAAVPLIEGTAEAARAGYMPGGSRRNLEWVLPHTDTGGASEEDLLLLADAQTSGGLLVAGELRRRTAGGGGDRGTGPAPRQPAHSSARPASAATQSDPATWQDRLHQCQQMLTGAA